MLLALEYEMYFPQAMNFVFSDYVLGADPGYLWSLPGSELRDWIFSSSTKGIVDRWLTREAERLRVIAEKKEAAQRDQNDRGDRMANRRDQQSEQAREAVEALKSLHMIKFAKWDPGNSAWRRVREFVAWCRERNVEVVATYPNTVYFEDYRGGRLKVVQDVIEGGFGSMGVEVLGRARESMFSRTDFFDTIYHLNREGSEKRTDALIRRLKASQAFGKE